MATLTDLKIKALIRAGEPFEGIGDGEGLTLCWPRGKDGKPRYTVPIWRFRYRFSGQSRVMQIGNYGNPTLKEARNLARELKARVSLGYDPAGEKQARKIDALAKIESDRNARTVNGLIDEFMARYIEGKLKRPEMIRQRLAKHVSQGIGKMRIEDVKPFHVDGILCAIVDRGNNRLANDVLHWVKRLFDYAITRHYLENNPAAAFKAADAGGKNKTRDRALSLDEIALLLATIKDTPSFPPENALAIRLLLLLGVRKMELLGAPWEEIDLVSCVWKLPAERTKTGQEITIPLPSIAVEWLKELQRLSCGSAYVFPRKIGGNGKYPHMSESALNLSIASLEHGIGHFVIHDLRRTTRSQLAALRIPPHICEACLNHKIKGVEGVYDRYDYLEERREALNAWAQVLIDLESDRKIIPIGKKRA